jgi:hypothetical protein
MAVNTDNDEAIARAVAQSEQVASGTHWHRRAWTCRSATTTTTVSRHAMGGSLTLHFVLLMNAADAISIGRRFDRKIRRVLHRVRPVPPPPGGWRRDRRCGLTTSFLNDNDNDNNYE